MPPGYGRPPAPRPTHGPDPGCRAAARGDDRGMTPPLPLPVRVAAGLVATAVEQARDLPRLALELPVTAVSQALQASMRVQQKVTELAIKGDRVLGVGPPIEDEPAWATFDDDPPPRRNGRAGDGPAKVTALRSVDRSPPPAPGRTGPAVEPGPGTGARPGSTPGRPRRHHRRRPTRRGRPAGPARLRLAHHPAAARQAAPSRGRRPARAAGLGAGARRPAAVRDDAEQPDRRGHRGVTERRASRAELRGGALARPHRRPQDRRVGGPARRRLGRGPARAGHRAAGHGHRVPRPPRPRRGRVAAAHRPDRAGPATAARRWPRATGWWCTASRRSSSAAAR